ncbi:MAG TPA: tetratricopeptide repeat protein [Desulfarculaceae bacterium]|nr:tetratricopeptide repeat protein [Desulfarculaceae bacterium]
MAKKLGFLSRLKGVFKRQKVQAVDISDGAIESLEEQLKKTPNNFRLRLKIADIYLTRGDREQAITEYCNSARLYAENDFIPLAIATYKKILNEDPENLDANLELGRIYQQKKFYADATSYLKKSFDYYHTNGQQDKALQLLEIIIEIAPEKEPYQSLLKKLFPEHQENTKSIYSDIIVAKKNELTDIDQLTISDSFFDLGESLGTDIENLEIEDDSIFGSETLSDADEKGEPHGVEEIFKTLRSTYNEGTGESDPDKFHYNLALAYNELKMPEQALLETEEVLKSNNFRLSALLLRSQIFFSQGSLSTALAQVQQGLLEKALTMQDFLTFKLQLGLILKEMGHYPQALEAFREAHSLDPDNHDLAEEIESLENISEP